MDLTKQVETMIELLSSDHTEEDDHYQKYHLSRGSCLYVARLWDGIVLWGNEIRLDKLSYPMALFNENDFSAVYGKPVSQYMREKRIERAKELLETTDESIGEIALASGYEHQGKFGSVFRDSSGVSPLEYRRLNRKT